MGDAPSALPALGQRQYSAPRDDSSLSASPQNCPFREPRPRLNPHRRRPAPRGSVQKIVSEVPNTPVVSAGLACGTSDTILCFIFNENSVHDNWMNFRIGYFRASMDVSVFSTTGSTVGSHQAVSLSLLARDRYAALSTIIRAEVKGLPALRADPKARLKFDNRRRGTSRRGKPEFVVIRPQMNRNRPSSHRIIFGLTGTCPVAIRPLLQLRKIIRVEILCPCLHLILARVQIQIIECRRRHWNDSSTIWASSCFGLFLC